MLKFILITFSMSLEVDKINKIKSDLQESATTFLAALLRCSDAIVLLMCAGRSWQNGHAALRNAVDAVQQPAQEKAT